METLVDPADAAINSRLTKEEKIRFLREMFRIRRFEQTSLKYYNSGKNGRLSPSLLGPGSGRRRHNLAAGR